MIVGIIITILFICVFIFVVILHLIGCKVGFHKPDNKVSTDGVNRKCHCKKCGKELIQDSQGNWFY